MSSDKSLGTSFRRTKSVSYSRADEEMVWLVNYHIASNHQLSAGLATKYAVLMMRRVIESIGESVLPGLSTAVDNRRLSYWHALRVLLVDNRRLSYWHALRVLLVDNRHLSRRRTPPQPICLRALIRCTVP